MKLTRVFTVCYSQIYLEADGHVCNGGEGQWSEEDGRMLLCTGPRYLIIGTARSIDAPFSIELLDEKPDIDLAEWDHVNLCSLQINKHLCITGDFAMEGMQVTMEDEQIVMEVAKGAYGFFICYKNLNSIEPMGLKGDDAYHVFMWPSESPEPKQVLKQWSDPRLN